MLLSTMTSQSRGTDTNEGLVVSILGQLTRLHAHQANEARVVVPCAARTLTKTSRLHLSLRVLNFSISRPRSNVKPMIEPIGWLRTLQFVATDACVTPRCRGRGSSSSFSRKNRRVCERTSACVHLFSSYITYSLTCHQNG